MKKLFKRFIALTFAFMLFAAPASSTLAASVPQPVLVAETQDTKQYRYEPTPLILAPGSTTYIFAGHDTWHVPQNKAFFFQANFTSVGNVLVQVHDVPSGDIYYSSFNQGLGFFLNLESIYAHDSDKQYLVSITNTGNSYIYITDFAGLWS